MTDSATRIGITSFWAGLPPAGRWFLATTVVQTLGRGLVLPFTLIYMTKVRGASLDTAGYLMAAIALAAVAVTVPTGQLIDRLGARAVIIGGTLVAIAGSVIFAFATTTAALLAGSLLIGLAQGSSFPAFHSYIAAIVDGPVRTQFFGINFAMVNLGLGVGGVIGGLFVDLSRPWTFSAVFLGDAAILLVPLAVLLGPLRHIHAKAEAPAPVGPGDAVVQPSYWRILRRPAVLWMSTLSVISSFVGYGQFESGVPAFAVDVAEVTPRTIGLGFGVNTLVIVLLQFAVMRWSSGHRRTRLLMLMGVVWAVSWLVLAIGGVLPGTVVAAAAVLGFFGIFGVGETLLQSATPAIVNDLATDHERGRYNAINAAAYQLGAIVGPAAAGVTLHRGGSGIYLAAILTGSLVMLGVIAGLERHLDPKANGLAVVGDPAHPGEPGGDLPQTAQA